MVRITRVAVLLVAVATSMATCAPIPTTTPNPTAGTSPTSSPPTSTSSTSIATTVRDAANGIGFQRPTTWARWQPNQSNPISGGPLIYLSTEALLASCATTPQASPNPPDARGMACEWPLVALSPNGVLVTWVNDRILRPLPTDGEVLSMNGGSARLEIERPGSCAEIGADETMSVLVPIGQPTPLSNIGVLACIKGLDLVAAEAQFRALLTSTEGP